MATIVKLKLVSGSRAFCKHLILKSIKIENVNISNR